MIVPASIITRRVSGWKRFFQSLNRLGWHGSQLLTFLIISTNHRIFENPFTISEATSIVQEWLDHPIVDVLHPTERH